MNIGDTIPMNTKPFLTAQVDAQLKVRKFTSALNMLKDTIMGDFSSKVRAKNTMKGN